MTGHVGFVFEETSVHDYRDAIVFEKLCVQNVFCSYKNEKTVWLNTSGLKTGFD